MDRITDVAPFMTNCVVVKVVNVVNVKNFLADLINSASFKDVSRTGVSCWDGSTASTPSF